MAKQKRMSKNRFSLLTGFAISQPAVVEKKITNIPKSKSKKIITPPEIIKRTINTIKIISQR